MKPIKEDIAQRINAIRKKGNYSMENFGRLVGDVHKSTVNNWEKAKRIPEAETLEKIAILGDTTVDEILYGGLDEYVFNLAKQNFGIELTNQFLNLILLAASPRKLSYNDDVKWLESLKKIFETAEVDKRPVELLYIPITGIENLYLGQIRNDRAIEKSKKTSEFIPIYYAFADVEANCLHVVPFPMYEHKTELFFKEKEFITKSEQHSYFTRNFNQLGLILENSAIIVYGIRRFELTENIQVFTYNQNDNSYKLETDLEIELFPFFSDELEKEILKLLKDKA